MTRKELSKIRLLVEGLIKTTRKGSSSHELALKLQEAVAAPPTIGEIILGLPAETHKARAALIGLSRQGYYNLVQGLARPNTLTAKRLADLTGLAEEQIRRAAGP